MGDLYINAIKKQEEGIYQCVASNVLGAKTAEAEIIVNGKTCSLKYMHLFQGTSKCQWAIEGIIISCVKSPSLWLCYKVDIKQPMIT